MSDDLTAWDYKQTFSGKEAAHAIVGLPPPITETSCQKAAPVLERMRNDYEELLEWFADGPEHWVMSSPEIELVKPDDKTKTPAPRVPNPSNPLPCIELQVALASIDAATSDLNRTIIHRSRMKWLRTNASDFERQQFTRSVLARWVQKAEASTQYQFIKPAPQASSETAAPVEGSRRTMKKSALIAELENEWHGIEADLKEGKKNGLIAARVPRKNGWYYVEDARQWAEARGKLRKSSGTLLGPSIFDTPKRVNRLQG
mgnify:CR=1 FL=1